MRFWIYLLGSLACALMHTHSSALSVAIVRMARYKSSNVMNSNTTGQCVKVDSIKHDNSTSEPFIRGEFDWSESLQGIILGANFYMYLITPTLSGRLSEMFGAKLLTLTSVTMSAIITGLIPISARYSVNLLIVLLVVQGMSNGSFFYALFSLYANWFTPSERSLAIASIAAFSNLGCALTTPIAGYLVEHGFAGGWPSVFYVVALVHIPWVISWIILVKDSPLKSHLHGIVKCSEEELTYLKTNNNSYGEPESSVKAPWIKMLTSKVVWATTLNKTAANWIYYLLLTKLPSYLDKVFGISMISNGLFNSFTTLAAGISMMICGPLSEYLIKKYEGQFSRTTIRIIFQTVSLLGPSLCLLIITFIGCDSTSVVTLMIVSLFLYGFMVGGEFAVISEFAPDFSGTLFGLTTTLSVWPTFVAPYVVGLMLDQDPGDRLIWNNVFYITIAICVLGTLAFIMYGSAEAQEWGLIKKTNTEELNLIDEYKVKMLDQN